MHMLETHYQAIYARKTWGRSFIRHLHDLGVLSPLLTLAHMVYADEADYDLLYEHRVGVVHNPSSNLRLRSGIMPLASMDGSLRNIGIGLDGQSLDEDQDYWRELRLAWTLGNRPGAASRDLSADAVLDMGSHDGAEVTFVEPDWDFYGDCLADLILLDWQSAVGFWTPDANYAVSFADVLLRRANRSHVRHVMANGEWVIRDGQSTQADEAALAEELREALAGVNRDLMRQRAAQLAALGKSLRAFYADWDAPA
jgi:cytosine/adenosine deaminase-related metal-dependent hydrolase